MLRPKLNWLIVLWLLLPKVAFGQSAPDFYLTVSPIFLNLLVEPGGSVSGEIKVKNNGNKAETLKTGVMKFRSFDDTGRPLLSDPEPEDEFINWLSVSESDLTLSPGESRTVQVTLTVPSDAALGYYYAVTFTRNANPPASGDQNYLIGVSSVLILLDVKSDATERQVNVVELTTDRRIYDYLPVTFRVKLRNGGNIHVSPYGNIFINRGANKEVGVLEINSGRGNILPDSERLFTSNWSDGFPIFKDVEENGKVKTDETGKVERNLTWDFNNVGKFRWGKYTAHLLMVYDNGDKDIPIEGQVSFYVIPWQILSVLTLIILLALTGTWFIFKAIRSKWKNRRHV